MSSGISVSGNGPVSGKLIVSTIATLLFVGLEIGIGFYANSLALIGDALHNFTDALALLIALGAVILERRPATSEMTFGYQRAGVLAAFINAGTLVGLTIFLFIEAWQRFRHPEPVSSFWMMTIATVAVVLNVAITLALREEGKSDLNIRAAVVHMIGDAVSSLGIILAAFLIRWTGKSYFDPLVTVLIGAMILWSAWGILIEAVNLLLEGVPKEIDPEEVARDLRQVGGVLGVHHLHIWALAPSRPALSAHVQLGDVSLKSTRDILHNLTMLLRDKYAISHTTIQFEHAGCPPDDPLCVLPDDDNHWQPC